MFTKMPAFLSGLFEVFRVEPAVATVEARLMFHSLDEEQRSAAVRWGRESAEEAVRVQQQVDAEARARDDADALERASNRAMGERASQFNLVLSAMGARPLTISSTGNPAQELDTAMMEQTQSLMFAAMILPVAEHRGDPPCAPQERESAEDFLVDRISLWERVGRVYGRQVAEQLEATFAEQQAQQHLIREEIDSLGIQMPNDPLIDGLSMARGTLRMMAALALPRERLFDVCVALHRDRTEGLRVASQLAGREARPVESLKVPSVVATAKGPEFAARAASLRWRSRG